MKLISKNLIDAYEHYLANNERSKATIDKYMHDVNRFVEFISTDVIDKEHVLSYKAKLETLYAVTSANSMIAAINSFLRFAGWEEFCVKQFKVQKKVFCSEEQELSKQEYLRLLEAARKKGNHRLNLIIQTICGTGIRVSELAGITIESVQKGETNISCKGKTRTVFIVSNLRKKLLRYAKDRKITSGPIFITSSGKPVCRSNIWREMKALCEQAEVSPTKVFPHNLRHLFARIFYGIEKDIAKLADVLGHSSINTTRIYIISTGLEHRRSMEKMRLII